MPIFIFAFILKNINEPQRDMYVCTYLNHDKIKGQFVCKNRVN